MNKPKEILAMCEKMGSWFGIKITNLNQLNTINDTPLHTVCSWGDAEAVQTLIDAGADVNAKGDIGSTPLFNAIVGRNPEVIKKLINAGAKKNVKNSMNWTPLQYAKNVKAGSEIIKLLEG